MQNDRLLPLMLAIVHPIACLCFSKTYNRDVSFFLDSSAAMIIGRFFSRQGMHILSDTTTALAQF